MYSNEGIVLKRIDDIPSSAGIIQTLFDKKVGRGKKGTNQLKFDH